MKPPRYLILFWVSLVGGNLTYATPSFFRTVGLGIERQDLYYYANGKDMPLAVHQGRRSTFYAFANSLPPPSDPEASAQQGILIYRLEEQDEGMEPRRIPVARVEMTGIQDRAMLAVFQDPEAPGGIRVEALPDGVEAFPPPGLLLVNLTPVKLGMLVSEQPGAWVPPNGVRLMNLDMEEAARGQVRQVTIGVQKGEGGERVYTNNWVFRPGMRTLVLMRFEDGQFRVERLPERVQAASSAPASP